jgi:hypothetical protein
MNRIFLLLIPFFMCLCNACTDTQKIDLEKAVKEADKLQPGESFVKITVNDKNFYDKNLAFNTQVQLFPQSFKASLMDAEKGNIELDFIKKNWNDNNPIQFSLTNTTLGQASVDQVIFMIGKIVNSTSQIGEGYLLAEGKIVIKELSKKRIIIQIEGFLTKPGDATVVENYVPVSGCIIVNKPIFTSDSAKEILKKMDE